MFCSHSLPLFTRQAPAVVEGVFLCVCFVVVVVAIDAVVIVVLSKNVGSLRGCDLQGFFRSGAYLFRGRFAVAGKVVADQAQHRTGIVCAAYLQQQADEQAPWSMIFKENEKLNC